MARAQSESFHLRGHEFTLNTKKESNEDGEEVVSIELDRIDASGDQTLLLSHVINGVAGDCNSISLELGDYRTTDSTIAFYTFWCRKGDAPVSPYGAREQVYLANEKGQLRQISSRLYIETTRMDWAENKGVKYLHEKPQTAEEEKHFKEYISTAERDYNASFVWGAEADELLREVKGLLKDQISTETKLWDKDGFGTKF